MRHWQRLAVVVTLAVFISPFVAAGHFDVSVDVLTPTVNAGDGEKPLFNISVTNTGSTTEEFTVRHRASNTWYNGPYPSSQLQLAPGATGHTVLYVNAPAESIAGRKGVYISVTADNGEEIEEDPTYRIQQDRDVLITDIDTDSEAYSPRENVTVTASIMNVLDRQLNRNEYQAVFALGNRTETSGIAGLRPGEEQQHTATFKLGQFDAGVMTVVLQTLDVEGGSEGERTANTRVQEQSDINTYTNRDFNGISGTRTITAENQGNLASEDTVIQASVPSYLSYFVSFATEPAATQRDSGTISYTWNIGELPPGASETVTYRINYWTPLAIIAVLLIAAVVGIRELRRPHIKKKTVRKNGKNGVHLTVKNRSSKNMDNVVVKDFVPSIATLIEKFDSSPPEQIRQGEEGTELEWKLGRMTPGEERILTYQISPQVEVEGNVTLPSAQLKYKAGETEKKQRSHHTTADFR